MKSSFGTLLAAAAALYPHGTAAITSPYTPSGSSARLRWGVPESAVSSGKGDVYFQIEAPATYAWMGIGIGDAMAGSQMFLIYQDGSGNVTLSPRKGANHVMPEYESRPAVQLLSGSGVKGNTMTANIRCGDCDTLKLGGTNSWIAAWKEGASLDSKDPKERIAAHDGDSTSVFSIDLAKASFKSSSSSSSSVNPFTNAAVASSSSSSSGSAVESQSGGSEKNTHALVMAHGVLMTIVFVAMYPIGAILMPLLGKWFIHAGWQTIAFLGMWAGFGLGYVIATREGMWWTSTHVQFGTIVIALLGIQPVLGYMHHAHFRKHKRRGVISHVHIWYGRSLMILGIVNGGLGLKLAGGSTGWIAAYSVVAGVLALAYVGSVLVGMRRKRDTSHGKIMSPQMTHEEHP